MKARLKEEYSRPPSETSSSESLWFWHQRTNCWGGTGHQTEEIVLGNTVTSMSLMGKNHKKKSMKAQLLAKTMDPTSSKRPKNNQNIIQNQKKTSTPRDFSAPKRTDIRQEKHKMNKLDADERWSPVPIQPHPAGAVKSGKRPHVSAARMRFKACDHLPTCWNWRPFK